MSSHVPLVYHGGLLWLFVSLELGDPRHVGKEVPPEVSYTG